MVIGRVGDEIVFGMLSAMSLVICFWINNWGRFLVLSILKYEGIFCIKKCHLGIKVQVEGYDRIKFPNVFFLLFNLFSLLNNTF